MIRSYVILYDFLIYYEVKVFDVLYVLEFYWKFCKGLMIGLRFFNYGV